MALRKFVDVKALGRFKQKIDETFMAYPKIRQLLPENGNKVGDLVFYGDGGIDDLVFCSKDERLYIYTSSGFKQIPWADEILFVLDGDNNICQKES